ncbi:hypothetical protein T07_1749 [Trichinella nelsoni]|uniref:Uncharacterized protein n=1 Tax=Trichinella nelsoni TaxID=6336 RepID=A0A0V0RJV7_9BILA|nr:hypothetical protein T07_1749 [Trichinella nelsoni]
MIDPNASPVRKQRRYVMLIPSERCVRFWMLSANQSLTSQKFSDITTEIGQNERCQSDVFSNSTVFIFLEFAASTFLALIRFHAQIVISQKPGRSGSHFLTVKSRLIIFLEHADSTVVFFFDEELSFDPTSCSILPAQMIQHLSEELQSPLQRDQFFQIGGLTFSASGLGDQYVIEKTVVTAIRWTVKFHLAQVKVVEEGILRNQWKLRTARKRLSQPVSQESHWSVDRSSCVASYELVMDRVHQTGHLKLVYSYLSCFVSRSEMNVPRIAASAIATEAVYKAHCQEEISTLTQAQPLSEKVMNVDGQNSTGSSIVQRISDDIRRYPDQIIQMLLHEIKPVVVAKPGKGFPCCAVLNLGSTRSRRHETIAGCSAQSHSKNIRSCPQPPDSHIAGSGKHSYYTQAAVGLA